MKPLLLKSYIDGEWVSLDLELNKKEIHHYSPLEIKKCYAVTQYSLLLADQAAEKAKNAFNDWKIRSLLDRKQFLGELYNLIKENKKQIIEILRAELGLSISECDEQLDQSLKIFDYWNLQIQNKSPDFQRDPMGVVAVVCGFSDPLESVLIRIIPVLLSGNVVVYKPSEKTPWLAEYLSHLINKAKLPRGVFNCILGDSESGRRLVLNKYVSAVTFLGSNESAVRIQQDLFSQPFKKLILHMGSKNGVYIDQSSNMNNDFWGNILKGCYRSANQKCTSLSWIFVHKNILQNFLLEFHSRSKSFEIGHAFPDCVLSPLIDSTSVDRYLKFIGMANREGLEIVMRGKRLDDHSCFVTPCIVSIGNVSLDKFSKSVFYQTEFLSPLITVIGVESGAEASELINSSPYCFKSACFSENEEVTRQWSSLVQTPIIDLNSWKNYYGPELEILGFKKSGNHQSWGLSAVRQVTVLKTIS